MQIPILSGIYTDNSKDFRVSYPRNLVPTSLKTGISNGYLRPCEGITLFSSPDVGLDRAAIAWNNKCFRLMGDGLVQINQDGQAVIVGGVSNLNNSPATMDYSFSYLAINSDKKLYLFDGSVLKQVTDPDLGDVLDVIWIGGYFMTTDGEFVVATELNDPFSVNPLKYGSSEADPDKVVALKKIRNEAYVVNRHTIEVFDNIGGDLFPFQRIEGAQIMRGALHRNCTCVFLDSVAFIGSGRNEGLGIYVASAGSSTKISTRDIDLILEQFDEDTLKDVVVESRVFNGFEHLWVRLPDRTLVFDAAMTKLFGEAIWFTLTSSNVGLGKLRAVNPVYCYNKWLVGDTESFNVGYLDDSNHLHWGELIGWEFSTVILYNDSVGALINKMELIGITGRNNLSDDPYLFSSYSTDGQQWSNERYISSGKRGDTTKRLVYVQNGMLRSMRMQKFRGTSDCRVSFARLELDLEPLAI